MMFVARIALLVFLIAGCTPYKIIDVPSGNLNSRVDYIVLHATSQDFSESLDTLTIHSTYPVSSHYLIPHLDDDSYHKDDLAVYRLVPEHERAWHAGLSQWGKEVSLNDRSIGIEVVNEFYCNEQTEPPNIDNLECEFMPYPEHQIELLIRLLKDILNRYPELDPIDIVGHADIAPQRKSDPGPNFPWQQMYAAGIGTWYEESDVQRYTQLFVGQLPKLIIIQRALKILGYPIEDSGLYDEQTRFAFRAMQMHYRPSNYTGNIDLETVAILFALIEKYRFPGIKELLD
ncbi:N-acetylmuramoyl-L-alanine amidase [Woeseiaceae bacterium]|nr:N-acetylmuramoyl-L-alanine amidase [Woeseiaceae bacterium]